MKTLNCTELGKLTGYHYIIPAICKIFQYLEATSGSIRLESLALLGTSYVLFIHPSICKIAAAGWGLRKVAQLSRSHAVTVFTLLSKVAELAFAHIDIRRSVAIC
ncbi:hypothetical protein FIC94_13140 [Ochrobactrum teleogrylli]|uniref:Uncharacterized protein n=1 Tax=Ochrobactrum teleogrylli TaxID=2479765 RepID=A0ABY2Y5Y4_9HYPH|nr:hypothetical protein FIC94_13140 [[Ochrobactrum] teleogrylli]